MPKSPTTEAEVARVKETVYAHKDLFVGNLVSADVTAAMIRARLKEGQAHRYQTYWQILGLLAAETGGGGAWPGGGGGWQNQGKKDRAAQKGGWQLGQWAGQGGSQGWLLSVFGLLVVLLGVFFFFVGCSVFV